MMRKSHQSTSIEKFPSDFRQINHLIENNEYVAAVQSLSDLQATMEREDRLVELLLAIVEVTCKAAVNTQAKLDWLEQIEDQLDAQIEDYRIVLSKLMSYLVEYQEYQRLQKQNSIAPPDLSMIVASATPVRPRQKAPSSLFEFLQGLLSRFQLERGADTLPALLPEQQSEAGEDIAEATDSPRLVVYCLGSFKVYRDHQPVRHWHSLKGLSIFKYLLHHRQTPVSKDILMDTFWPDVEPAAARRNLHQAIYSIRRTFKEGQTDFKSILFENDCYSLDPEITIWLDIQEFNRRVNIGLELEKRGNLSEALVEYSIAEGLYLGDFLEEDLYEAWIYPLRQQWLDAYLTLANRLSECYLQQAEYTASMALCRKIIRFDRCHESAYRRLMKCYLAQGQRHLAIRQYLTCLDVLKEELDITPSEETCSLYKQLVQT